MKLRVDNEPHSRSDETAVLRAGQTIELRCTAKGGNPIPNLTFTKNGIPYGPASKPFQSIHSYVVTARDNGAKISCLAQNQADRHAESKQIQLNVLCKFISMVLALNVACCMLNPCL